MEDSNNISELKKEAHLLTHIGYAIRKDSLTEIEKKDLVKTLTVSPATLGKPRGGGNSGDSFTVYTESPGRFYVPRIWGIEKFGEAKSILVEGKSLRDDLHFIGTPYPYQTEIVNKFIDSGSNGLICVPCGRGKTFMAINIAAKLKKRFIVVVDKEFLLQQWSGELKSLMPDIRIGILQENRKELHEEIITKPKQTIEDLKNLLKGFGLPVSGSKEVLLKRLKDSGKIDSEERKPREYDCCIAMIQTLVNRDFSETDFRGFGFTIFDECHHLGASHFSQALLKLQTKKMLGLSATPTRDDGLTKVFEWFIGKPVYWEKIREADPDVLVKKIEFTTENPDYNEVPTDFRGDICLPKLITQIVECEERNEKIDEILRELVKEKDRKILVLSDRISHLQRIEQGIPKDILIGYYIGGMKEEKRESEAKKCQVLLGSYSMASEAMNIKSLNTMIMASPRKKIEQSTGRILRTQKSERNIQPQIIDIVDSHSVYQGQWAKRKSYYKKCAYKIQTGFATLVETEKVKGKKEKEVNLNLNLCLLMESDEES